MKDNYNTPKVVELKAFRHVDLTFPTNSDGAVPELDDMKNWPVKKTFVVEPG